MSDFAIFRYTSIEMADFAIFLITLHLIKMTESAIEMSWLTLSGWTQELCAKWVTVIHFEYQKCLAIWIQKIENKRKKEIHYLFYFIIFKHLIIAVIWFQMLWTSKLSLYIIPANCFIWNRPMHIKNSILYLLFYYQ